jgi:hypothetical protein
METSDTGVRPFAAVLQDLNGGATVARLSAELHDLVEAVTATGKAGTLTLTLKVAPVAKRNTDALNVTAAVAAKRPQEDAPTTVFFVDGGSLVRNNPAQPQLPLREVPAPDADARPIREVRSS